MFPIRLFLLSVLISGAAFAQTYTPKTLRFEGVPASEQAQLVTLTGLKAGTAITKEQIEAALQKLADSGGYADMSYTVGPEGLVVKLTPVAGNDVLPVRYGNFVWWKDEELEQLVEKQVANFRGDAKLHSPMTDQICDALVMLAKTKGVDAKVIAVSDPQQGMVVLRMDSPQVVVGQLTLNDELRLGKSGGTPALMKAMQGEEFDAVYTPNMIVTGLREIYGDGGYLDAVIDPPVVGTPQIVAGKVVVNVSARVQRGELYKVKDVVFAGAPAGTEGSLRKEASVTAGGAASPGGARRSNADIEAELAFHGYLGAKSQESARKDVATHTVSYIFTIRPGMLYQLSGVDASQATPDMQKALAKDSRLRAGVVLNRQVMDAITEDVKAIDPQHKQGLITLIQRDEAQAKAGIVLKPGIMPPTR